MAKESFKGGLTTFNSSLTVLTPNQLLSGNFILEACILAMKSVKNEICLPENSATHAIDMKTKIYYILIETLPFIGVINNIFSLITIFQNKYNRRLLPQIMRILYISNFMVASINSMYFIYRLRISISSKTTFFTHSHFLFVKNVFSNSLIKLSDVLITVMSIIKYIYSRYPFQIVYTNDTYKYTTLGVMTAIFVCFTMELDTMFADPYLNRFNNAAVKGSFFITCLILIVIFNSLTLREGCLVRERLSQAGEPVTIILTRRLAHYTLMSSAIFLLTTLFPALYLLLPVKGTEDELTCKSCYTDTEIHLLVSTMPSWNCYLDNLIYCVLSAQYRNDLHCGLKKMLPPCSSRRNTKFYNEANSRGASRRDTKLEETDDF